MKLSNKWRVSARVTPEMNRGLNELVDFIKEKDLFKVRGRSARREHIIQLALLELIKQDRETVAKRLSCYIPDLESSCE
ncbi:MAG: hypothetical protein RJA81_533 [Planctomycetota bacterium]|jgi:hypothetical protein